jgi:hypothetical protein
MDTRPASESTSLVLRPLHGAESLRLLEQALNDAPVVARPLADFARRRAGVRPNVGHHLCQQQVDGLQDLLFGQLAVRFRLPCKACEEQNRQIGGVETAAHGDPKGRPERGPAFRFWA